MSAFPWDTMIRTVGAIPLLSSSHRVDFRCCKSGGEDLGLCKLGKSKKEEWRPETKKSSRKIRIQALPSLLFPSTRYIMRSVLT